MSYTRGTTEIIAEIYDLSTPNFKISDDFFNKIIHNSFIDFSGRKWYYKPTMQRMWSF